MIRERKITDDPYIYGLIPKDEKGIYLWSYRYFSYPLDLTKYCEGINKLSSDSCFLTYVDEEPIGSVNFITKNDYSIHLRLIVCQRGSGKAMLKEVLEYCFLVEKAPYITLSVFKENKRAVVCYSKVGFIIDREYEASYDMIYKKEWYDEQGRNTIL